MFLYSISFWLLAFVISLAVLIKSSDYFVNSSIIIGKALRLPTFIIGVLIVAVGTSLPELATSLFSIFKGAPEIVIGNVIGSNITNIFLVLGISAIFSKKIKILRNINRVELPLMVGSAILLSLTIIDGAFTITDSLLLIGGLLLYVGYSISTQIRLKPSKKSRKAEIKFEENIEDKPFTILTLIIFSLSSLFIFLGAKYTIDSVVQISQILNIGTEIIAISAIALGTSLPELIVSLKAVKISNPELAVGNILGSNIFNIFGVMGISGLFANLPIPKDIFTLGIPLMLAATALFYFVSQDKEISKWEGWLLLLFYVFFIIELFIR